MHGSSPNMEAVLCFVASVGLELLGTSFFAAWPARYCLFHWIEPSCIKIYRVESSNLDVWLQSISHCIIFALCLTLTLCLPCNLRNRTILAAIVDVATASCQAALIAKGTVVALLGRMTLLPKEGREAVESGIGLVYMFSSLTISLVGLEIQALSAKRFLLAWKVQTQRTKDIETSLVSNGSVVNASMASPSNTVRALLKYSAADLWLLVVAFAAGSMAALGQAIIPFSTGKVIDYASIEPAQHKFLNMIAVLAVVSLICAIATGLRGGLFTMSMTRLNIRIRQQLFSSLLRQELGFYDANRTGDIISRLSADTTTVSDQICLNVNVAVRSLTQAAMVFIFMLSSSWRLTVITMVILPFTIMISKAYGNYFRSLAKKVQTELAEANSIAEEMLASMLTVKSHAAEESAYADYSARLKSFHTQMFMEAMAYAAYMATNTLLPNLVNAAVLLYGGSLVLVNRMSAGALVSFMLYQQSLAAAFQSLGDVFTSLVAAVGAADKVIELIQRQPLVTSDSTFQPVKLQGTLGVQNVSFAYPARPSIQVLRNISFNVEAGKVVALVGSSGSGKSSIVKLIERVYVPSSGYIHLDNRDLGSYDFKWLRRQIALVNQEPVLFARSIKRNICFGLENVDGLRLEQQPSQTQLEQAARHANAHDFIAAMPHGYETDVGDKGVQLSGGQKQRLAIARALIRQPTILLLDEATSSLDSDTEAVVQEALQRLMTERTTVVVAHRLTTIQNAHQILVIDHGEIMENGQHHELLAAKGIYASLIRRQLMM